tara:strand:- start:3896 stop:4105 length:210 start_codon:yes stop_codon:yes gene_type:complete
MFEKPEKFKEPNNDDLITIGYNNCWDKWNEYHQQEMKRVQKYIIHTFEDGISKAIEHIVKTNGENNESL